MELKCKSCGAALDAPGKDEFVKCQYCGTTNKIPHSVWESISYKQYHTPYVKRSFITVFLIVFFLVIGIVSYFQITSPAGIAREWYSPGCLVDANGDKVLDIVGLSGSPMKQNNITLLNGKTGKIIDTEHKISFDQRPDLFAPAPQYLCMQQPDLKLKILNPTDFSTLATMPLPDKIKHYQIAEKRFCVECFDGSLHSINLENFESDTCTSAGEKQYLPHNFFWQTAESNGVEYHASSKYNAAVKFLIITATQQTDTLWSKTLSYENIAYTPCLAIQGETVATFGRKPGDKDHGYLVGLDKKTGKLKFAQKQESTWSTNLVAFYSNQKYIIAHYGAGLFAFDPETGKVKWRIGGR